MHQQLRSASTVRPDTQLVHALNTRVDDHPPAQRRERREQRTAAAPASAAGQPTSSPARLGAYIRTCCKASSHNTCACMRACCQWIQGIRQPGSWPPTCWLLSSGLPSSAIDMADSPAAIAPRRFALPPACQVQANPHALPQMPMASSYDARRAGRARQRSKPHIAQQRQGHASSGKLDTCWICSACQGWRRSSTRGRARKAATPGWVRARRARSSEMPTPHLSGGRPATAQHQLGLLQRFRWLQHGLQ